MPRRPWMRTLQRPSRGGRAGWVKMLLMLRTGHENERPAEALRKSVLAANHPARLSRGLQVPPDELNDKIALPRVR